MDWEKWCLRIGAGAVVFALAVRLIGGGAVQAVVEKLTQPEVASALLFMETGRILRPIPEEPLPETPETPEAPEAPENTVPVALPAFSPSDADLVKVHAVNGYDADLPALLAEPLSWKLKQTKPTVLIVHSHGTESYTKTEDYDEHSKYRTRNTDYNVVSIGAEIKRVLEAGGISVIHDTTCHDYPSYSKSYSNSRKSVKEYLAQYPSIEMVLDIHRDAIADKNGEQVHYVTETKYGTASRLMMVVGTDANGLTHPNWPDNMALAVKLHACLEKKTPGICRPISFRKQRFNQDLSPGALIVEVGSAGNTRQEALLAGKILADAIIDLSFGANG